MQLPKETSVVGDGLLLENGYVAYSFRVVICPILPHGSWQQRSEDLRSRLQNNLYLPNGVGRLSDAVGRLGAAVGRLMTVASCTLNFQFLSALCTRLALSPGPQHCLKNTQKTKSITPTECF